MTVLGALVRHNLNNPEIPATAANISDYFDGSGPTLSGVAVTEKRAYGLTAYYRAVTVASSTMAAMPVKIYENGTRKRVTQETVLDNPNPRQTKFEFRQSLHANAMSWGNGYAFKYRDGGDVVREAWIIHPSKVRFVEIAPEPAVPDGKLFFVTDAHGREQLFTSWDIFHMPYMSPWGTEGMRPLALARQVLGINVAAEDTAARFYGKGTMIAGILRAKDKLDKEQRLQFKQSWRELVQGPQNVGGIAVLDNGGEFQPVSLPPGDAQLLESRQFGVEEVARLTGIHPSLLMMTGAVSNWGTGIEQQNIGMVQYTFAGWLAAAEQRYTRELLPGGRTAGRWFAEHDVNGLLRGDMAAKSAYFHQMKMDGNTTKNEIRGFDNLEPVEGGDDFLLPAGVLPESLASMKARAETVGVYVRAGFEPAAALAAVGLDPIEHTGLVPVTVTVAESLQGGNSAPSLS